jgi:outer membrane lipoprotein LolB
MRCLFYLGLVLLGGCTIFAPHPVPFERPELPASAPFTMNGRISVNNHGERHSAGLHWTHSRQSDEILLLTPLGQTAARVFRDHSHATLDDGDKHYQDTDAESLMDQVLGWHLPLNDLHLWLLGMPDSDEAALIERDDIGRISVLHQSGWIVHYLHYADNSPDSLPTRLRMDHENMQVQLLIDEWAWNPE